MLHLNKVPGSVSSALTLQDFGRQRRLSTTVPLGSGDGTLLRSMEKLQGSHYTLMILGF